MKRFEGKVNDKTFNDEQEFYKAAIEAMKGKGYTISSSYTESPESPKEDSPKTPKTQEDTPKTPKVQEDSPKLDKIKIEPLNSDGLLANDYKDLDSYIRSAEDRFDDWLVAFDENYETIDIKDILNQERVQRMNLDSFKKDYNEQLGKVNKWYETADGNRLVRYDNLNKAKANVEKLEKDLLEYTRTPEGVLEGLITIYDKLNDARGEVTKWRNDLVKTDEECKKLIVEKNYLAKVEGYIKLYDEYLKGIRDIIDLYTAGDNTEDTITAALAKVYEKLFGDNGIKTEPNADFAKCVDNEDEFVQFLRDLKKTFESWK